MLMTAKKGGATLTVAEAMALLRVSKTKIARMIREGDLHATTDPLDKRFKLIARAEVMDILARTRSGRGDD